MLLFTGIPFAFFLALAFIWASSLYSFVPWLTQVPNPLISGSGNTSAFAPQDRTLMRAVRLVFCATVAWSFQLVFVVLSELISFRFSPSNPASSASHDRLFFWKLVLAALVALLAAAIPILAAYLSARRLLFRMAPRGGFGSVSPADPRPLTDRTVVGATAVAAAAWAVFLYKLGVFMPQFGSISAQSAQSAQSASVAGVLLDSLLFRVAFIGVTLMGVLCGVGSVSAPYMVFILRPKERKRLSARAGVGIDSVDQRYYELQRLQQSLGTTEELIAEKIKLLESVTPSGTPSGTPSEVASVAQPNSTNPSSRRGLISRVGALMRSSPASDATFGATEHTKELMAELRALETLRRSLQTDCAEAAARQAAGKADMTFRDLLGAMRQRLQAFREAFSGRSALPVTVFGNGSGWRPKRVTVAQTVNTAGLIGKLLSHNVALVAQFVVVKVYRHFVTIFAIYCVFRLFNGYAVNLPRLVLAQRLQHPTTRLGVRLRNLFFGSGAVGTTRKRSTSDAVAQLVAAAASGLLGLDLGDKEALAQVAGCLLSGGLFIGSVSSVVSSLRSFIKLFTASSSSLETQLQVRADDETFLRSLKAGSKSPVSYNTKTGTESESGTESYYLSSLVYLILAQLMGMYFIATTLMLGASLPASLHIARGSGASDEPLPFLEFGFVNEWFEKVFLGSSFVYGVVLFLSWKLDDGFDELGDGFDGVFGMEGPSELPMESDKLH